MVLKQLVKVTSQIQPRWEPGTGWLQCPRTSSLLSLEESRTVQNWELIPGLAWLFSPYLLFCHRLLCFHGCFHWVRTEMGSWHEVLVCRPFAAVMYPATNSKTQLASVVLYSFEKCDSNHQVHSFFSISPTDYTILFYCLIFSSSQGRIPDQIMMKWLHHKTHVSTRYLERHCQDSAFWNSFSSISPPSLGDVLGSYILKFLGCF